jgi:hypothetical protein
MEDHIVNYIVCYTGGTCGDLITAMIDPRNVTLVDTTIVLSKHRQQLKKPHLFTNNQEKTEYLDEIFLNYNSIPSHDLDYHVAFNHKLISIAVQDFQTAIWAATRFKQLHRPHVWQEMCQACGVDNIKGYAQALIDYSNMVAQHTTNVLQLEHIVSGQVVESLEKILNTTLTSTSTDIYRNWLLAQHKVQNYNEK